jgi:hypothetical protein
MRFKLSKQAVALACLCGLFSMNATAARAHHQQSNVYAPFECVVGTDCNVVGHSNLVRNKHGVTMNIFTTELDPGAVYTVWWIIFNEPENCPEAGCSGADLGTTNGAVIWATGHVVGNDGFVNLSAHLSEGDTSGDQPFPLPGNDVGLVDASKAEIHLVVRTHGDPIPGSVYEQLSTFLGGCDDNTCADQQFAVHP